MKTVGIIAEYNPFHNGHAYQIEKIRNERHADFIIVAMSGDFIQRGAPAIVDKYARTKMALAGGADFVFELPVVFATSSAESFAHAGVALFEQLGCVDELCFGAETDNLSLLSDVAALLADEPADYRAALSSYLKEGINFPSARAKAVCDSFAAPTHGCSDGSLKELSTLLSTPNNILALEYLKALKKRHSSISPFVLKREGAGYHETAILENASTPPASATAIRGLLLSQEGFLLSNGSITNLPADAALTNAMPDAAYQELQAYCRTHPLLCADDFSELLGYRLLSDAAAGFSKVSDITPEIANRLIRHLYDFESFSQFCEQNKSRDITYTRMSRILLHLLLNIKKSDEQLGKSLDYCPYLRPLGFRQSSASLFSVIKKTASVPVLSKLSAAQTLLSSDALSLLEKDIFASELYLMVQSHKALTSQNPNFKNSFASERSRQIVIL